MIRSLLRTLVMIGVLQPSAFAAVGIGISYSGTIPRNVGQLGSFDLDVKITNMLPTQRQTFTGDEIFKRLKVVLPKVSRNGGEITPTTEEFQVALRSEPTAEQNVDQNFDVTVYLRFVESSRDFGEILTDGKGIEVRISYDDKATDPQKVEGPQVTLLRLIQIPAEAPETSVTAAHRGLNVSWVYEATVPFTGGAEQSTTGTVVVVIPNDQDQLKLPAYLHQPNESSDKPGDFCSFAALENGGICINCADSGDADTNFYLNLEALKQKAFLDKGVRVVELTAGADKTTIAGLSTDKPFSVFTYYKPDGAGRSQCAVATPTTNYTLAEVNGESAPDSPESVTCFVATAAFGTPLHPALRHLRWFRDHVLERVAIGRSFINWYYAVGPSLAHTVKQKPLLKQLTRAALVPAVMAVVLLKTMVTRPLMLLMVTLSIAIMVVALRQRARARAIAGLPNQTT